MEIIKNLIKLLIIYIIIGFLWQGIELYMEGAINPSKSDSIIGLFFATSVYINLQLLELIES